MPTFDALFPLLSYQTREFLLVWTESPFTMAELLELIRSDSEADASFILAELESHGVDIVTGIFPVLLPDEEK